MADLSQGLLALGASTETSVSDLLPYLVVLGVGFLVGAWGQSAKSPVVVLAGLLLVIIAVIGFIIEFPACPGGTRCL